MLRTVKAEVDMPKMVFINKNVKMKLFKFVQSWQIEAQTKLSNVNMQCLRKWVSRVRFSELLVFAVGNSNSWAMKMRASNYICLYC